MMSDEELEEDLLAEMDLAKCIACGAYYCTCCGCDCWYEEDEED